LAAGFRKGENILSVNEELQLLKEMVRQEISGLHTCCAGKIISSDGRRAAVQPDLKYPAGDGRLIDYPVISNVPVVFPSAGSGKISLTFPLAKGDGVTLLFSERSLDAFLSGGDPEDPRRYDLTDAIAVPGLYAGGVPAAAAYPDDLCLTNGAATIRLTPAGDVLINGRKLAMAAKESSSVEGGDLVVNGVSVTGHTHSGVQPGGGNSGPPNS
jgi:hypothetical protein